ncbi:SMP-30/gluconolactonase/LRE family protein [Alkalimarinus alittae]|uniref:SMP-30/gluconolactonase/LRE family protein n=1 Tax=Alkalimarinus alittae TaxID=2961619 RepID=A0ABY6N2M5_9ALTE|nr:SMP-30/gluconolactonase/LRE family protein [Alkalimarinus alittae]UZE96270.1 SMP-30/gluconolactonase/LRE family protein [Alkalimarinus alittae]
MSVSPFYPIEPHFSGQCKPVTGVTGAEDITIDHANQFAYISADDRRATMANKPVSGGIYGLDLSKPDARPLLLTSSFSKDFHPHGIYLYHNDKDEDVLFVINHRNNGEQQIEIFDINDVDTLTHRQSITYPELVSPNDIVAISPTQFYATNDHGYPPGHWMQPLEDYLGLPLSTVSYYDGKQGHIVVTGLQFSNGIAISPNLKTLYVAEIMNRKISIFDRDTSNGSLSKRG